MPLVWFFDAKRASVGALFDMGVYATSQLIAAVGSVVRVFGRMAPLDKPTGLPVIVILQPRAHHDLDDLPIELADPVRVVGSQRRHQESSSASRSGSVATIRSPSESPGRMPGC